MFDTLYQKSERVLILHKSRIIASPTTKNLAIYNAFIKVSRRVAQFKPKTNYVKGHFLYILLFNEEAGLGAEKGTDGCGLHYQSMLRNCGI